MRAVLRQSGIVLLSGVAVLSGAVPAVAAPVAPTEPVALVVGLRPGAAGQDPAARLEARTAIDVVDTDPVTGNRAVTVEVSGSDAAQAAVQLRRDPAVAFVEPDHVARVDAVTANDPLRGSQWGVDVARVAAAWQRNTGSAQVTVAVVDTGVTAVSDLRGALLPGYNAITGGTATADDHGHGTQTATVLAGRGNNAIAGAGICWSCKILPVKVLAANGAGDYSKIAAGVTWAADNGADIINLSLGGSADSQLLRAAVAHAVAKGALVVAAAGNSGSSDLHFPAAIPAVLSVGASTVEDTRYSFSNHGSGWVDIAAPGCNPAQTRTGAVKTFCGTSSAAPFLSGVAALALTARPDATAAELAGVLTRTATAMSTRWVTSGRVNAAAAVDLRAPSVAVSTLAPGAPVRGGVLAVPVNATDDVGVRRVELRARGVLVGTDTRAPFAPTWMTGRFAGVAALELRVYDLAGNQATTSRSIVVDNTAPAVRISRARAHNTRGIPGTTSVTAGATDQYGIGRLELLVNGKVAGRANRTAYTFPVQTGRYGKVLRVQVRAYDRAGNVAYTPTRTWYA